jgi:nuclear protein localization family protein 4
MPGIVIRVRTKVGTWRVADVALSDTFADLRKRIEEEHHADLQGEAFTSDPAGTQTFSDNMTVGQAKLTNGHMIYAMVDESKVGAHEKTTRQKTIRKDGTIVNQDISTVFNSSGFRPGMLPLRNMKMHWTLNEFISLDEQFQYKIKSPDTGMCKLVSVDKASVENFQNYMRHFDFRVMRYERLLLWLLPKHWCSVHGVGEQPVHSLMPKP